MAVSCTLVAACQSAPSSGESSDPSVSAEVPAATTSAAEEQTEPSPGMTTPEPGEVAAGPRYEIAEQNPVIDCGADPTAIEIEEGMRVYFAPGGRECPVQGDSDSVVVPVAGGEAVADPGMRFDPSEYAGPHKRILRLADGSYRMYFHTRFGAEKPGIGSAISSDGLNFTKERGLRISAADAGFEPGVELSPGDIVPTTDGRYRMYFSSLTPMSGDLTFNVVKSAVSDDLLNWTVEEGERVGGTSTISGGEHPSAIANPDGSVTLFYGRNINLAVFYSTSQDGLTFEKEDRLIGGSVDTAFIRQPDGTLVGFVGRRDNRTGISSIDRVVLESVEP